MQTSQKLLKLISWTLKLLLAASFIISVFMHELSSNPETLKHFISFGFNAIFMYFIGVSELVLAIAIFIPRLSVMAALGLIIIMIGASYSHLILAKDPWQTGAPSIITAIVLAILIFIEWAITGRKYLIK